MSFFDRRPFRIAFTHFRRFPFHALGAILILSVTFYLLSRLSLELAAMHRVLQHFESLPQATAFFSDEATDQDIEELKTTLTATGGVSSMKFVSKQEALKIYQDQNKNDPLLLEMVTADILPASLEASAVSPEILPKLAEIMKTHPRVEEVAFNQDVIARLNEWGRSLRLTGIIRLSIFFVGSILIVMMVISTNVAGKRREFEILRLLGATRGHIVSPFLLEGLIYGVVGAFIGWGFSYLELLYSTPLILKYFGDIPLLPVPILFMLGLLSIQLLVGVLVGVLASFWAAKRFLK